LRINLKQLIVLFIIPIHLAQFAILAEFGLAFASERPLVAIDIGHHIAQPGATSARGVSEFYFNHELAIVIQNSLEHEGIETLLINADGQIFNLFERTQKAKGSHLFLSIHHDSVQPSFLTAWNFMGKDELHSEGFQGFSLFISRKNPFPLKSLKCASAVGEALKKSGFKPSRYHALPIQGEGRPFADEQNGVHYFDDLIVLRTAASPAFLMEAGVITDPDEETKVSSQEGRDLIARSVVDGLNFCFKEWPIQ
jgi:N-acetylmuramoyl-L-alanine amidase